MNDKDLLDRVARLESQVRALGLALWLIAVAALAVYLVRLHRPAPEPAGRPAAAKGPPSSEAQSVLLSPEGAAPSSPAAPKAPAEETPRASSPPETEPLVFPGFQDASPSPSR